MTAQSAEGFSLFGRFANAVARLSGRAASFVMCCLLIFVWAATGPLFRYSDTWLLVVSTGTSVVTFLMVFLIQNTQNRDGAALQAKLDELIRVTETARNSFVGIEKLPDHKLQEIREDLGAEADSAAQP